MICQDILSAATEEFDSRTFFINVQKKNDTMRIQHIRGRCAYFFPPDICFMYTSTLWNESNPLMSSVGVVKRQF